MLDFYFVIAIVGEKYFIELKLDCIYLILSAVLEMGAYFRMFINICRELKNILSN